MYKILSLCAALILASNSMSMAANQTCQQRKDGIVQAAVFYTGMQEMKDNGIRNYSAVDILAARKYIWRLIGQYKLNCRADFRRLQQEWEVKGPIIFPGLK